MPGLELAHLVDGPAVKAVAPAGQIWNIAGRICVDVRILIFRTPREYLAQSLDAPICCLGVFPFAITQNTNSLRGYFVDSDVCEKQRMVRRYVLVKTMIQNTPADIARAFAQRHECA